MPFEKGNKHSKGRPKGSKHTISESYLRAMARDFEHHGAKVIERVRERNPDVYLRLIGSLVPRDFRVEKTVEHYVINAEPELSIEQWRKLHMLKDVKEIKDIEHIQ